MGTEVAHVVDLPSLSQSELVALAAASPYAVDPRRGRDADVLPPPKIDRAVFNESAGSRKQTFSRHRVATNLSHNLTAATASASSSAAAPTEEDYENRLIVFHLQRLFARDDPSYPSPPPIPPQPQTLIVPTVTAPVPAASSLLMLPPPDRDREVMNPHGVAVDLARLAELVDPYGEEIRKRTAGLGPESELLRFMNGLEGQWGSQRRRRKFVDAAMFGDHLPCGWKLLLGLKRKERVAWINCRRYVSPKGDQFATCNEVSSFLMSLLGYPEAKPTVIRRSSAEVHDLNAVNSVGLHQQTDSTEEKQSAMPVTSVALSSHSGDSQRKKPHKDEVRVEANAKECRKCNLNFRDQGAYVQHQLSFHQRKAKRHRVSKPSELGVSKDGKCETQECQKTSEDRHGHFGHGVADEAMGSRSSGVVSSSVADVRSQGQSPAKLFDGAFSGVIGGQLSLAAVPSGFQEMTALPEQEKEPSAREPDSGRHKDPLQEMTDFLEVKKGHIAGESVSGDHQDPVDNSDDHKIHYGACHNAEKSLAVDAASQFSTCNDANVHENDSSKDLELPSADCFQNFIRPDETCSIHKEVPPTTDTAGESEYADDPMECTDVTQSKQVSEPCDQLDGKFGIVPEENNFNNPAESNPLSATLGEPDLNSIGMEIDDGNIACKYGDVINPISFENDKPVEDKIVDCAMTALKDGEIHSDARIRNVNLNSCLDAISSPISGAKYETSNALDDANQLSIIVQCFGASSNDDNACDDENFVNQNSACKAENIVNHKNDMVYQSNLTMDPISPAQINVDCFTSSCSMTSEIKNNGNTREHNSKEQLVNSRNISSNETGFDVEAYNNDVFNGTITENSLAQLNSAINMKTDFPSCYSLSDLNTLTGGTATDEIDIHGMRSSFVNGSTSRNEPNEHCTLDLDINGSMLEALEKSDSELENQYNGGGPACDSLPAPGTSGSIDDFLSMQTNFGSLTSLVRAVEDVPLSRIIQDQHSGDGHDNMIVVKQCDLQLGFGGQKQQMFPSFEQQLRMASAGAPQFGGMSRHNSVPVPEPTLMLGYAPQLGSCPPVQLGWDLSLSKMVGGCVLQTVCVWCSSQFQHFGTVAEQRADSLGFICPACKEKISGHRSMLNGGSSQL